MKDMNFFKENNVCYLWYLMVYFVDSFVNLFDIIIEGEGV